MRHVLLATLLLLVLGSCASTSAPARPRPGELQRWGSLHEALREGRSEARVALASVSHAGVYGLGALEGLRGEITLLDGEPWITDGTGPEPRTTRGLPTEESATFLFALRVPAWRELEVEADVAPTELDAYVAWRASELGLDTSRPFAFLVEGELRALRLHVLGGECPRRARAEGREPTAPGHERAHDALRGRLVGLYATDSAGILCHAGARTHVHALLEHDGPLTGHVDAVGLAAGARLFLPQH